MFIERHGDLLKDHGSLVTIIDDSILSGKKYIYARKFIRDQFIIRAVISLPGDAFQRVGARAKTSILYLIRRAEGEKGQPYVFMAQCEHVGLDDVPMKTRPSKALQARQEAEHEINEVVKTFRAFLAGQKGPWLVPASMIADRLDVKSCLPREGDITEIWSQKSIPVLPLDEIVERIDAGGFNPNEFPEQTFTLLRVGYDGIAAAGETALGRELTYDYVQHPSPGDLVVSNINATHGATCVISEDLRHAIVSSEFTIMRVKDDRFTPWYLWGYLRSTEVRARLVSQATGIGRHRIRWEALQRIPVPLVPKNLQEQVSEQLRESVHRLREAETLRDGAMASLNTFLDLETPWAVRHLKAAKPPK